MAAVCGKTSDAAGKFEPGFSYFPARGEVNVVCRGGRRNWPSAAPVSLVLDSDDECASAEAGICSYVQPRSIAYRRHADRATVGDGVVSLFADTYGDRDCFNRTVHFPDALGGTGELRNFRCDGQRVGGAADFDYRSGTKRG